MIQGLSGGNLVIVKKLQFRPFRGGLTLTPIFFAGKGLRIL